jgi:hypothetical protein
LRSLLRNDAENLVARLNAGGLRGTSDDSLPAVKGKSVKLPEGDKPFAARQYWAGFVVIGDPF